MADPSSPPPEVRALLEAAAPIVRGTAFGRLVLARAAAIAGPETLPTGLGDADGAPVREPLGAAEVHVVLERTWDASPTSVLDALDDAPVAVTATGQVHRGVLDGRPLAVKVRRPGLAATLRLELLLLEALRAPLSRAFGALDTGALLREVRATTLDALDGEQVASTQRQARRLLRGVSGLEVPAPVLDLCGDDVLVMGWLDGPTLAQPGVAPADPDAVARTLVAAHAVAAHHGLALADLRPGHVVLLAGGGVGLLGCGTARAIPAERAAAARAALTALRAGDDDAFAALLAERPDVGAHEAADRIAAALRGVAGDLLAGPARLDRPALAEAGRRAQARGPELLELASALAPDRDDLVLARSLVQLGAVLARVGATQDWGALVLAEGG